MKFPFDEDDEMAGSAWIKFFMSDWRADPRLRMCSLAARGLWMEMLCIMAEAEPVGHLVVPGVNPGLNPKVNLEALATLVGRGLPEVKSALTELETFGVFSRTEKGTIYSRRMVRDYEKSNQFKEWGTLGGNPRLKGKDNPRDKARLKPQSPESPDTRIQNPDGGKRKRSLAPLPENWQPKKPPTTEAGKRELAKMRDWALANDVRRRDWDAQWRNWKRKAVEFMKRDSGPDPGRVRYR